MPNIQRNIEWTVRDGSSLQATQLEVSQHDAGGRTVEKET